jgi:hypothetical protein
VIFIILAVRRRICKWEVIGKFIETYLAFSNPEVANTTPTIRFIFQSSPISSWLTLEETRDLRLEAYQSLHTRMMEKRDLVTLAASLEVGLPNSALDSSLART